MAIFDIKFLERLYTLSADPITEKKQTGSHRGGGQGPTRPFTDWMDAVNQALKDLLLQTSFQIDDAFLEELGLVKDPTNTWQVHDLLFEGSDTIRLNTECDVCITGLNAGRPSQQVDVLNVGLGRVAIKHQSTLSLLGNRINTIPAATIELAPGVGLARLYYDGDDDYWRVILHEQGAALSPPADFLLTAYSARGGTWDVSAAVVNDYTYYLKGAMLTVFLRILGTTATGPADQLTIELPLDYVAKKHIGATGFLRDEQGPLTGKASLLQVEDGNGLSGGRLIIIDQMNGEGIVGSGVVDFLGQFTMELSTSTAAIFGGPGGSNPGAGGAGGNSVPGPGDPALPSGLSIVQGATTAVQLAESCQDAGGNWAFMDAAVEALRATDPRWGYNGKRGNVADPSKDAIAYYFGPGDPWVGSNQVYVVDIINCHCPEIQGGGCSPSVAFTDVTCYDGSCIGAWVYPRGASPETNPNTNVPVDETTSPPGADAISIGSINFVVDRDPSGFAKTSNLSSVRVSTSQVCLDYDKKNSWTQVTLGNGVVAIATPWVGVQIGGTWTMSTWEFMRPNQTCKGLQLGNRVVWDDHVQGALRGKAPVQGQQVLFMVTGVARSGAPAGSSERTQVVQVTWPY
jgi:hypothetical protein